MERHGAAHRITASKTQDPTTHHQVTRASDRVIPATWSGDQWLKDGGQPYNADELEEVGLDPSLRTM